MDKLTLAEVARAVNGALIKGSPDSEITGVSTDTRSLRPGELFFALKGEHSDGHGFIGRALEAGAGGLVISDEAALPDGIDKPAVKVQDMLWSLGDLAASYRSRFDIPVIGITGSVGKTTTKEMLSAILERRWKVLKNELNYNNEIGVPLTIFKLDTTCEALVLEMAMRGLGEIRRLAEIARPQVGVITNIGISHIERLGSQGAIADAKSELLQELPLGGLAVLNAEDGYFRVMRERFSGRVISFGSCKDADVVGARIRQSKDGRCECTIMKEGLGAVEVSMPVIGYYNVYNALAAAAVAIGMGFDLYAIKDGLENFTQPSMRMELTKSRQGFAVLNDAYNASPASVFAALKTLEALAGYDRKIVVLGDMLELGDYSSKAHKDIGSAVANSGVSKLLAVGELAGDIVEGARSAGFPEADIQWFPDSASAAAVMKHQVRDGDAVLVKGSRAMKMEEIVRTLLGE